MVFACWTAEKMSNHVNRKFNQNGFFICQKNEENKYDKICFGQKISYALFLNNIKNNAIFLDSGMYHDSKMPNTRLYSTWRADKHFWNNLIIESH